ncbi:MAG: hypothetical protein GTN80_06890 [Nitrososphaeria archaeon]|nr:hypothetical protein [Nitrososphaeria archaeon]NIQ33352.1 hypothetical protein [Nitrososphaeria archaeon]
MLQGIWVEEFSGGLDEAEKVFLSWFLVFLRAINAIASEKTVASHCSHR